MEPQSPDEPLDFQMPVYDKAQRHRENRRSRLLIWSLVGIVAAGAVLLFVFRRHLTNEGLGERLMFGANSLYYTYPVTEDEARKFGQYLHKTGIFDTGSNSRADVLLGRDGATYIVTFPTTAAQRKDPALIEDLRNFKDMVSRDAFDGAPVVLHLCDLQVTGFGTAYVHKVIE